MAMAIFRIEKIHGWAKLAAVKSHNDRTRDTPNANPEKPIQILFRETDPKTGNKLSVEESVKKTIDGAQAKGQVIRSNAVLAVEIFAGASPEYFRPDDPNAYGVYDDQKLNTWKKATCEWIHKTYPHVASIDLHLDEATPHIHAIIVPIDERGKLCAKSLFDGKSKLSQLQTQYAQAVAHLGLERGIEGSKAKHVEIRQYYGAMGQEFNQVEKVKLLETKKSLVEKRLKPAVAQKVAAELKLKEANINQTYRENAQMRSKLKETAEGVRRIPLETIMGLFGAVYDQKKPIWDTPVGKISIKDEKFINRTTNTGGGGAIDLTMHLGNMDAGQAISFLGTHLSPQAAIADYTAMHKAYAETQAQQKFEFRLPTRNEKNLDRVKNYLVETRKIPESLVNTLIKEGKVYADHYPNCVFVYPGGAEVAGVGETRFKGYVAGSSREQYWEIPGTGPIVLCESPIEAMSVKALSQHDAHAISVGGTKNDYPWLKALIEQADTQERAVLCGFNNDSAGQNAFNALKTQHPKLEQAFPPQGFKDFNDQLKAQVAEAEKKRKAEAERQQAERAEAEKQRIADEAAQKAALEAKKQQLEKQRQADKAEKQAKIAGVSSVRILRSEPRPSKAEELAKKTKLPNDQHLER